MARGKHRGILATSGVGNIAFSGTVQLTDLALDGIVATMVSDAVPDAVALAHRLGGHAEGEGDGDRRSA